MLQQGYPEFGVTTDDVTPTLLAHIPVPTGEVAVLTACIIARRTDGTVFAANVAGTAQNDTGTPTLVGSVQSLLRSLDGLVGGVLGAQEPQIDFVPATGGIDIMVTQPPGTPVVWEALVEMRRTGTWEA